MRNSLSRWESLCKLAAERGVAPLLGVEIPGMDNQRWDGLWLREPGLGSGIALSPALDLPNALWVFAHELGHEYCGSSGLAAAAHLTTDADQKKWGQGRTSENEEETANLWAAQQLISDDEWQEVEAAFPGSLRDMADALQVPVAAALWKARGCKAQPSSGTVRLTPQAFDALAKPINGRGGIQSLLRSLQACQDGPHLSLRRRDFERMREYLVNLGGGGKARLSAIMESSVQAIRRAGGLQQFFVPN